jgi:hypothetical protein
MIIWILGGRWVEKCASIAYNLTLTYVQEILEKSEMPVVGRSREVVILRPGFIFGERDRTILPKLISALRKNQFVFSVTVPRR